MKYDIAVIGGGIVGLATALKITEKAPNIRLVLIDKEKSLSVHQTGNNSGVIHSGIYYKPGSLKARNCTSGYRALIDFCDRENIRYELCGKIIVATSRQEIPALNTLYERGTANGLRGLEMLSQNEMREIEPYVCGLQAIRVPQTGIIDFAEVSARFGDLLIKSGQTLALNQTVTGLRSGSRTSVVVTDKDTFEATVIINCAGLHSDRIARMTTGEVPVRIIPFRGEYYKIRPEKNHLVRHLIYPVPDPSFPFLGVHFTRMIRGGIEAGPNAVLAFAREGYKKSDVNIRDVIETLTWPGFIQVARKYWKTGLGEMVRSFSKKAFTRALQHLIPEITESDLVEGGSGVRAQACDKHGGLLDDFMILEDRHAIHVLNAPSPAATSSLSIGDTISDLAVKRFEH
jgi:L-2-hydroxyglutarate oxidase